MVFLPALVPIGFLSTAKQSVDDNQSFTDLLPRRQPTPTSVSCQPHPYRRAHKEKPIAGPWTTSHIQEANEPEI